MSLVTDPKQPGLWVDQQWTLGDPGTFAVVIGVSRYPHLAGGNQPASETYGLGQLHVSALTAFKFFEWLRDDHRSSSGEPPKPLPLARCWLLLAPTQAELDCQPKLGENALEPTLENCKKAILDWHETMRRLPRSVAESSVSFFFFSGHGLEIHSEQQILLPSDYLEPGAGSPYDALSTLNLAIGVKTLNVHTHFFLLDACRNDDDKLREIVDLTGMKILVEYPARRYTRPPCYTPIFYASASGTQAWEPRDPTQGPSVFGQAILDGLTAGSGPTPVCGSGACVIPVHLLDGHLKKRVSQVARQGHQDQYAVLGGSPIDSNAVVTEVAVPKGLAPKGSDDRLDGRGLESLDVPTSWSRFDLDDWRPIVFDTTPLLRGAHEVFGSERVSRIWMETARLTRLADGLELGLSEGYAIHRVTRDGTRSYRIQFSVTAERGNYCVTFLDTTAVASPVYALLLPDDRPEQAGYQNRGRPRFLLEVDFSPRPDVPNGPTHISRLDLSLSDDNASIWLKKAATIARLNQQATLTDTLMHDDFLDLQKMLDGGVRSPLAALVVAIVLLRAGRIDAMESWLSELATKFHDLPDGAIFRAEWLLQMNDDARPPIQAIEATLSLLERGLPFTNQALIYANRQVDSYLLEQDLKAIDRGQLESLQRQLQAALRLFRSGGLFCTFFASDPARLTPELFQPIARSKRLPNTRR
jgi:hypothetical protein